MAGAPYTVHPFFANGHGSQCWDSATKPFIPYILPPGVHFVTIQEAGEVTRLSSTDVLRTTFYRGFDATRMVPKPSFHKNDNQSAWCTSDYMAFKHEISRAFEVIEASVLHDKEYQDLYPFLFSEHAGGPYETHRLSFSELITKGKRPEYRGMFDKLCSFYDRYIHVRYPGEVISDNNFVAISSSYDKETNKFLYLNGAFGLVDGTKFAELDTPNRKLLTSRISVDELNKNPKLLPKMLTASFYPNQKEIEKTLENKSEIEYIKTRPDEIDKRFSGKALFVFGRKYQKRLSELIPEVIEAYNVSEDNPIVIYYPVCRRFSQPLQSIQLPSKKAANFVRSSSLERETTGHPLGAGAGEESETSRGRTSMPRRQNRTPSRSANRNRIEKKKGGGTKKRNSSKKVSK